MFDWSWVLFRTVNEISRKFLLGTVPWLAKILKVKALIGASSLNIVEFWQNFNDRFNVDVVI